MEYARSPSTGDSEDAFPPNSGTSTPTGSPSSEIGGTKARRGQPDVVAVGTSVARRPPHRSVRERLTHTALELQPPQNLGWPSGVFRTLIHSHWVRIRPTGQGAIDFSEQLLPFERLADVIVGISGKCLLDITHRSFRGQHDDREYGRCRRVVSESGTGSARRCRAS